MFPTRRTFLKQLGLGAGGLLLGPGARRAWALDAPGILVRSTPEAEGVSSAAIEAFLDGMAKASHELHSFMFARHGRIIAEGWSSPYAPELKHMMYSMSKSFTSTAVGFAVAEGRLKVDDHVVTFFPWDLPEKVSDHLAALRVKDLLTMSVGSEKEPTGTMIKEQNWVRSFLAHSIAHEPGTVFLYNSAATYMCSAIVHEVTGQKIIDYLRPRLFDPLEIKDATWEMCPRGINTGGWGLSVPTEALAKFGQLYLQKGKWKDRQVLPQAWVEEATAFHIQQPDPAKPTRPKEQNDWLQGYGYQFWRSQHRSFRGDGAFGQFTIVLPEQDAVIAMTGESASMQGELDLVWEHLLPAMKAQPLPADAEAQARLRQALSSLALAPSADQPASPTAARVSGKTFTIQPGPSSITSVTLTFHEAASTFTARTGETEHAITCHAGRWHLGEAALPVPPPRIIVGGTPPPATPYKIAGSGGWKDEQTYVMTWRYIETPHHDTVTCRFDGDEVKITFISSISAKRGHPGEARVTLLGRVTG